MTHERDPEDRPAVDEPMTAAEQAQVAESAAAQNLVAVTGPAALLLVPLAKGLALLQGAIGRRLRRRG